MQFETIDIKDQKEESEVIKNYTWWKQILSINEARKIIWQEPRKEEEADLIQYENKNLDITTQQEIKKSIEKIYNLQ